MGGKQLTELEADAICTAFEMGTDGMWPHFVAQSKRYQVDIQALCSGVAKLAAQAGVSPPFTQEDFE